MDYSLSYGHHGLRPCSTHLGEGTVSMGQATGPIYTCETTGRAPVGVLDAHPERHRGTIKANLGHPHEMCVQLLPTKPQYSTGWYASQQQAIGQLYTRTNHHHGAWARRAREEPCGGYVGLASKPKL